MPERVQRAGRDQSLARPLVHRLHVGPLQQVEEAVEGAALLPRLQDRLDRRRPQAANRTEPEADRLGAHHRELPPAFVHVGRQHLQPVLQPRHVAPQLPALAHVLDHVVRLVDNRREQRRHELGRVVALQPRGLVRQQRVGGGVGLVEAVAAEGLDLVGQRRGGGRVQSPFDDPLLEAVQLGADQGGVLFAHCLAQHVGLAQRVARQVAGDPHHLLLVDDDPVGGIQHVLETGRRIGHLFRSQLPPDVAVGHP